VSGPDSSTQTQGPLIDNAGATAAIYQTMTVPQDRQLRAVIMTEVSYNRIHDRIKNQLGRQAPSAWVGASFAFFGVAMSACLARLVLPNSASGLPAGTRSILVVAACAAAVVALVCFAAHRSRRTSIEALAADICAEMDTCAIKNPVK
jgi:hypothetical protein